MKNKLNIILRLCFVVNDLGWIIELRFEAMFLGYCLRLMSKIKVTDGPNFNIKC
jgi:hypothetical protein